MSQENVAIAKRVIDAYNRRALDLLGELVTSDFEFFPAMLREVEGTSYRGREGMAAYFEEAAETWEQTTVVAEEIYDLGDRVLALGRLFGRGRGSGVEVDMAQGFLSDFREGKMSRTRAYLSHDEALRAAGLAD
jgi:ketosteroid isomerase-like protein